MNIGKLPVGFDGDEDEFPSYVRNTWPVSPELRGVSNSLRSESEAVDGVIRCPECGDVVPSFFEHVDMDCTGNYPEMVAAGLMRAKPKGNIT